MMKVDYEKISRKIVNRCMRVKEDEVILVQGGTYNFELIEDIAVGIRRAGAFPVVMAITDRLNKRIIEEVPSKYLRKTPKYMLRWYDDVNGVITVDPSMDPRVLANLSERKVGARREGTRELNTKFIEAGIRWTAMGYPTKEKAKMFNIPFKQFWEMFWKAMNVNYDRLYEIGKEIQKRFKGAKEAHITSKKGTDLTFSIEDRNLLVDDGVISEEDIRNKDVGNNLPCGEAFLAPLEDSANGRAVFDLAFYRGNKIVNIDATFKEGKLIRSKAQQNEKLFKEVIRNSQGEKDRIGEFGIGLNPQVKKAIGYAITDEKIVGTLHIALGENRHFGGKNESTLHWDLVMMSPSIDIDDERIMDSGSLLI